MAKVAKLVLMSVMTRVVVEENTTEEDIVKAALPKLAAKIEDEGMSNLEEIRDDTECPWGTLKGDVLFARQCSVTGEGMNEGWVFGDGEKYFKYKKDAEDYANRTGYADLEEAYKRGTMYWTQWEDEADYQYTLVDGELVEIE